MREVLGNFQWRVRAFVLLLLDIIAMGVASFLALWVQSEFVFSDIGTDVLRSVYGYMPFNVVIQWRYLHCSTCIQVFGSMQVSMSW